MSAALASLPVPFWLLGLVPVVLAVLLWKVLVSAALAALVGWLLVSGGTENVMILTVALVLTSAAALLLSTRRHPFDLLRLLPEAPSPDTTGGNQPRETHKLETHA